jgi:glucose-6-phosphate isomerase
MNILKPSLFFNQSTGELAGAQVGEKTATIGDLKDFFADETARSVMDQQTIVYKVQYYLPVEEGTGGGLFFGNTTIFPGKVGDEYFMTKGHFHAKGDRTEFYWCIKGKGMLLLMDRNRKTWAEEMHPGSLHHIPPYVAHRTVNIGEEPMTFGACWPSDAGHDYGTIRDVGFSARLLEVDGKLELV